MRVNMLRLPVLTACAARQRRAARRPAARRPAARRTAALCGAVLALAGSLEAQGGTPRPAVPQSTASSQASTEVRLNGRVIGGRWFPAAVPLAGPAVIRIDYGQPHARGRTVMGSALVPMDTVWRFGANLATHLTTDVDLELGGLRVPRGTYTLFARPSESGWQLVVNRQTGQWGTDYDPSQDLGRVRMDQQALTDLLDSFTVWIVPSVSAPGAPPAPASGVMRFAWERTALSVNWRVMAP